MSRDFLQDICSDENNYLMHHGILGQRWGIRRFQNKDGSLTPEGRKRYLTSSGELNAEGKNLFKDRGDGTYYDTSKYSRKLGLVGGVVDLARYEKEKKNMKKDVFERSSEQTKEFIKAFSDKGWRTSKPLTLTKFDGSKENLAAAHFYGKMGDIPVTFGVDNENRYGLDPNRVADSVNRQKNKFEKEYKKVLSTVSEAITEDLYDTGVFTSFNTQKNRSMKNWTRDDFKSYIQTLIKNVSLDSDGPSKLMFYADSPNKNPFYNYEISDILYDIDADKVLNPEIRVENHDIGVNVVSEKKEGH